jgi:GAF domain-containing protein
MNSPDHWTDSLHLAGVNSEELDATLSRVVNLAVQELPGCDMAGITLIRDGQPVTAAFTNAEAPEIDVAQYTTGVGPCLDAFREGEIFRIDDTKTETRWPSFTEVAAQHGILSTLSLPLAVNRDPVGALNLYSRTAHAFLEDDTPLLFASHAAVVLANAQAYWAAHTLTAQLETALTSRAVIEQAKGILIARHRITPDEAFNRLAADSQRTNVKLRDVARGVVDTAVAGSIIISNGGVLPTATAG